MTNTQLELIFGALAVLLGAIALGPEALAIVAGFVLGVTITELARRGP